MSSESTAPKKIKRLGDKAEAAVIQRVSAFESVPDRDAQYHDARTTAPVDGSAAITVAGSTPIPPNTPVEIKSVAVVFGKDDSNGRFYFPVRQHQRLLAERGWYALAVCTPDPSRDILALKAVPVAAIDLFVTSWISVDDGADYGQVAWTRFFDESEVGGR